MLIKAWNKLPEEMRTYAVFPYYYRLRRRNFSLLCKRVFDVIAAICMLLVLSPLFLVLAIAIKCDSRGPVLFRQERVTQYGKRFRICKFRTMVVDAERLGTQVTGKDDRRVTRVGKLIRKCRLDEIPQLLNVLGGSMSFVGPRPEVPKYVAQYTEEMYATLLLPAGITSTASIRFKDEAELLQDATDADFAYVTQVLPRKMEINCDALLRQSFFRDIGVMFQTVFAVFMR